MTTSPPPSTTATTPVSELTAAQIYCRLRAGERRALARFLTELERASPLAADLLRIASPDLIGPPVIGITGPPGAGKSTLTNALVAHWRTQGLTIGVIAIDPSSPISRGAILGDRIRMTSALNDDGVFVRSLSSGGHLGGLSPAAVRLIDGFDAAGFDIVLLETVGTGQSEIDVAEIADVRVVVSAPGLGDDIQAMKSGLLEIADILVVNKADLPGAEQTRQQLAGAVSIRHGGRSDVLVLAVSSTRTSGIEELATTISRKAAV
jgi:LAO/AO transport system kinase